MRTCDCCGTTQGPFGADRDMPGLRACTYKPRNKRNEIVNPNADRNSQVTQQQQRIRECLARRSRRDIERYGPGAQDA
jgi:hypothetical protein